MTVDAERLARIIRDGRGDAGALRELEEKEREMIARALEKNHGKRKLAAQDLGISERTLYRKLKEYNLDK